MLKGWVPPPGDLLQVAGNWLCPLFFVPFFNGYLKYGYVGALVNNLDHKDESHILGMANRGACVPEDLTEQVFHATPGLGTPFLSFTGMGGEPLLVEATVA